MPLNEKKIISIILQECKDVEERCDGYREELLDTVSDILEYERQHRIHGTNIQQKINDKCNTAGKYLSHTRHQIPGDQEK